MNPGRNESSPTCAGLIVVLLVLVNLGLPGRALAQDPLEFDETASAAASDWGLALTPYAWFAAQASDVSGRKLRQSFNDLASITNVGFQSRLAARHKWAIFTADWTYARQESETGVGRTDIHMQLEQHILDMKLGVEVYDTRTSAQDGGMAIWAAAGARYWDNDVDLTVTTRPVLPGNDPTVITENTGQKWWDPVLGLAFHWPVTSTVGFGARATGGGFNIGSASKYMWDAECLAIFNPWRRFMIAVGYRLFKYDRTDGEGDDAVRQTVTVNGPIVGLSVGIF